MNNQILNLTNRLLSGLQANFMHIFYVLLVLFILILVYDFLRIKYLNNDAKEGSSILIEVLKIISKLFIATGFGFIISNIVTVMLNQATNRIDPNWNNLAFGIILLFIGIGFKQGRKQLQKENPN